MYETLAAVISVIVVLLLVERLYLRPVREISKERRQSKAFKPEGYIRISRGSLEQLSHRFSDGEDQVLWADRQHQIVYWKEAGLMVLLATFCYAAAAYLAAVAPSFDYTTRLQQKPQAHHIDLSWLAIVLAVIGLFALFQVWNQWLRWRAVYRIVTNRNLIQITQPCKWIPWLWNDEKYDPHPLEFILSTEAMSRFWGRELHYGTVHVKTYMQENEDPEFRELNYVRHDNKFSKLVNKLKDEARAEARAPVSQVRA